MRWHSIVLAALSLTIPFASQAAPAATPQTMTSYKVDITQFQFMPAKLEIPAGASVTWTNKDEDPHTVTSSDGQFKGSAAMDTGNTYSTVFAKPGTYAYFCAVHPFMKATIVVH